MIDMNQDNKDKFEKVDRLLKTSIFFLAIATLLLVFLIFDPTFSVFERQGENSFAEIDENKIENGIHVKTGLKDAPGLQVVINNCTNCHSAKLVIQNRMNEERWNATIRWMQKTQNLWELGENQKIIVDYLTVNYPVEEKGRRAPLSEVEWYELEQ